MTAPEDQPGGSAAVACGCSCPTNQPRAAMNVWSADPNCALHGLDMVAPLHEGEQHG